MVYLPIFRSRWVEECKIGLKSEFIWSQFPITIYLITAIWWDREENFMQYREERMDEPLWHWNSFQWVCLLESKLWRKFEASNTTDNSDLMIVIIFNFNNLFNLLSFSTVWLQLLGNYSKATKKPFRIKVMILVAHYNYRMCAIIIRIWFETALNYKPRISRFKKISCNTNRSAV